MVLAPSLVPVISPGFARRGLVLILALVCSLMSTDAKSDCCLDTAETGFIELSAHKLGSEFDLPSDFDDMVKLARLGQPDAERRINELGDDSVSRARRYLALRNIEAGNVREMPMLMEG